MSPRINLPAIELMFHVSHLENARSGDSLGDLVTMSSVVHASIEVSQMRTIRIIIIYCVNQEVGTSSYIAPSPHRPQQDFHPGHSLLLHYLGYFLRNPLPGLLHQWLGSIAGTGADRCRAVTSIQSVVTDSADR